MLLLRLGPGLGLPLIMRALDRLVFHFMRTCLHHRHWHVSSVPQMALEIDVAREAAGATVVRKLVQRLVRVVRIAGKRLPRPPHPLLLLPVDGAVLLCLCRPTCCPIVSALFPPLLTVDGAILLCLCRPTCRPIVSAPSRICESRRALCARAAVAESSHWHWGQAYGGCMADATKARHRRCPQAHRTKRSFPQAHRRSPWTAWRSSAMEKWNAVLYVAWRG